MLKSAPKISDPTKRHEKQLNLFDVNGTLAEKCWHADFSSVLDTLKGWFPQGISETGALGHFSDHIFLHQ